VYEIRQTPAFRKWLSDLKDRAGKARLARRIERPASGNAGNHRFLGGSLYELREHAGPGYRIYYTRRADRLVLLLAGGHKASQESDILNARAMIKRLEISE